jgi:hypothetical protein
MISLKKLIEEALDLTPVPYKFTVTLVGGIVVEGRKELTTMRINERSGFLRTWDETPEEQAREWCLKTGKKGFWHNATATHYPPQNIVAVSCEVDV